MAYGVAEYLLFICLLPLDNFENRSDPFFFMIGGLQHSFGPPKVIRVEGIEVLVVSIAATVVVFSPKASPGVQLSDPDRETGCGSIGQIKINPCNQCKWQISWTNLRS